jgi:hypothetical protein
MAKDEVAVEVGANNRDILTMPPWCSQRVPIITADQEGNFKLSVWTNRKGLPPTIGSNSFNGLVISCHDGQFSDATPLSWRPLSYHSHVALCDVARSVSAGTHGYFRSWGETGCAIRLSATAALDPLPTSGDQS